MKNAFWILLFSGWATSGLAQEWGKKFEQLGTALPTPNEYRTGSGAPGPKYWQQQADYVIDVELDDINQRIIGYETITYHNNSPDALNYLWVQLDQNVREQGSNTAKTSTYSIGDSVPAKFVAEGLSAYDYDGGFKIDEIKDGNGRSLPHTINKTMMRVDLAKPLKSGEKYSFSIKWWYNINDRMQIRGRGGYEYFPKDDNYLYTISDLI